MTGRICYCFENYFFVGDLLGTNYLDSQLVNPFWVILPFKCISKESQEYLTASITSLATSTESSLANSTASSLATRSASSLASRTTSLLATSTTSWPSVAHTAKTPLRLRQPYNSKLVPIRALSN